jgi:hypothetical protein
VCKLLQKFKAIFRKKEKEDMFGAEITNKNGKLVLGTNERTMCYWGYIDVVKPSATTTLTGIALFNIPSSFAVQLYVLSGVSTNAHLVETSVLNGLWVASVKSDRSKPNNSTSRIYVFTEMRAINPPSWGMQIFDAMGITKFHSGRPLLSPLTVSTKVINSNSTTGELTTTSTKVAAPSTILAAATRVAGGGTHWLFLYHTTAGVSGGSYVHGINPIFLTILGGPQGYGASNQISYPVIDASYYETFPNLGNYPQ